MRYLAFFMMGVIISTYSFADTIKLKSGATMEVEVLGVTDDHVKINIGSVIGVLNKDEVVEIIKADTKKEEVYLYDTGPPPADNSEGYALDKDNWIANRFKLKRTSSVTELLGWLASEAGTLTVVIYPDQGDLPDTQVELFKGAVRVFSGDTADWYGLKGINLSLPQGEYWVAFEVRTDDTYDGRMPYFHLNYNENENGAVYNNKKQEGIYVKNNWVNNGLRIKALIN